MTTRKLVAGAVLVLTILFPFRAAFLEQNPDSWPKTLISFLLVLTGAGIFGILSSGDTVKKPAPASIKTGETPLNKAA